MAKINKNKEMAKARMRLANIVEKFSKDKVRMRIQLRTDAMTKSAKLIIWADVLYAAGYRKESNYALCDASAQIARGC